jgi:hypothetical protein
MPFYQPSAQDYEAMVHVHHDQATQISITILCNVRAGKVLLSVSPEPGKIV